MSSSLSSSPLVVLPAAGSAGRVKNIARQFDRAAAGEVRLLDAPRHGKEVSTSLCAMIGAPDSSPAPARSSTAKQLQTEQIQSCVMEHLGGILAQLATAQQASIGECQRQSSDLLITTATALSSSMQAQHEKLLTQLCDVRVRCDDVDHHLVTTASALSSSAQAQHENLLLRHEKLLLQLGEVCARADHVDHQLGEVRARADHVDHHLKEAEFVAESASEALTKAQQTASLAYATQTQLGWLQNRVDLLFQVCAVETNVPEPDVD